MKYQRVAFFVFCLSLSVTASAQTFSQEQDDPIDGRGTPGYVAKFSGRHTVRNSIIFQSSNSAGPSGKIGIGTTNPLGKFSVFDTDNVVSQGFQPVAVYGIATSNIGFASAVRGDVMSGAAIGVVGMNFNQDGDSGGGGVEGLINATSGFNTAIRGTALGITGPSAAVFGEQFSQEGQAGLFVNRAGGDILKGSIGQFPDVTVFRVDGTGKVLADGGFQTGGADFAESMVVAGDRGQYVAGDLLVIDPTANRRLALAQQPYSTLVAGIYSTKPGILGSTRSPNATVPKDEVPLAVVGIVPCKVTAENGPIQVGDLLVTSSTSGSAMKGTDRNRMLGAVVGKALEPLHQGTGVIQVLVTLQ